MKKILMALAVLAISLTSMPAQGAQQAFQFFGNAFAFYNNMEPGEPFEVAVRLEGPQFEGIKVHDVLSLVTADSKGVNASGKFWARQELNGPNLAETAIPGMGSYAVLDYTIPEGGAWIGISCNSDNTFQYVRTDGNNSNLEIIPGGFMFKQGDGEWEDRTNQGILSLWATLESDHGFRNTSVTFPESEATIEVAPNQATTYTVNMVNTGLDAPTSLEYSKTINGGTVTVTRNYDSWAGKDGVLNPRESEPVVLDIPAYSEPGDYTATVKINKINGAAPTYQPSEFTLHVKVQAPESGSLSWKAYAFTSWYEAEGQKPYSAATKLAGPQWEGVTMTRVNVSNMVWPTSVQGMKIWIAKDLESEPLEIHDAIAEGDYGIPYAMFNTVIPQGGAYIGFTRTSGEKIALCSNKDAYNDPETLTFPGSFYFKGQDGVWGDRSAEGIPNMSFEFTAPGALRKGAVTFDNEVIEIPELPVNAAYTYQLPFHNTGIDKIDNLEYQVTFDGQTTTVTKQFDDWNAKDGIFNPCMYREFPIEIPAYDKEGYHSFTVAITKINGNVPVHGPYKTTVKYYVGVPLPLPEDAIPAALYDGKEVKFGGIRTIIKWDVALKLQNPDLVGMQVVGAKVSDIKEGVGNVQVWAAPTLSDKNQEYSQKVRAAIEGTNAQGVFKAPVTLTADGLFVGYTLNITDVEKASYWAVPYSTPGAPNSLYMRSTNTEWVDYSSDLGSATITVYLTGDISENALKGIKAINDPVTFQGKSYNVKFEVVNMGKKPVESVDYSYTINGASHTGSATLSTPLANTLLLPQEMELTFDGVNATGSLPATVKIEKVNGQPNGYSSPDMTYNLNIAQFETVKRPLMEEGTGTGCGWCPRGMVALNLLDEQYPNFIAVAIHSYDGNDPMNIGYQLPWTSTNYPCASIDRQSDIDPFYGSDGAKDMGIIDDYEKALLNISPANLDVTAEWDSQKQNITVTSTTKFAFAEPGQTYTMAYALTIDGLSHPDQGAWKQSNYFPLYPNDYKDNSYFKDLVTETYDLSVFNHVLIDGSEYFKGHSNSFPATLEMGKDYEHTASFATKDNELMEKPDHVHVVAMLLGSDGKVRNAAITPVYNEGTSGIDANIASDNGDATVYFNLQGQRVANPSHGIFIKKQGRNTMKVIL